MASDVFGGGWCGKTIGPDWTLEDRYNEMVSHGWRSRNWIMWPTPDAFPTNTLAFALPASQIISQDEARASAARIGRLIAIDPEVEATYATATH